MAKHKGIYKRGNVWWIRYTGLDGKKRFESTNSTSFKDAQNLLVKRQNEKREGKNPEIKRIKAYTFNELAEEYQEWAKIQKCYKTKKYFIAELKNVFGNLPLRSFTTMLIDRYQSEGIQAGYKPSTMNRRLATLSHAFTKAVEWDMVGEDVLKRIRKVKLLKENNRRLRYLSVEECQALVDACDPHLKPIVITALNTGMRKDEVLSLEWDKHIDLKHGFILLDDTKNGERREVAINDTVRDTIKGITRRLDVPYVFHDFNTGKRYLDVKRSFHSALRRAKIKDFRFHDLRHTFASHLVMAGVDITTVKELLGHKTLTMTLRYSHLAPAHKVKAVGILEKVLKGSGDSQKYTKSIQFGDSGEHFNDIQEVKTA